MKNLVVKYWRKSNSGKYHACLTFRDGRSFGYIDPEHMTPVGPEVQNPPIEERCRSCADYVRRHRIPNDAPTDQEVDMVRVVRIEHDGSHYYDSDIEGALLSILDSQCGDEYKVTFTEMSREEYEALPEFAGF